MTKKEKHLALQHVTFFSSPLKMFNPNIEANPQQKQAVLHIVNKSSFPAPYILYGPPGTGKTATLVEAIVQIHKAFPLNCILVCTPSNTAADEIARRLLKFIETSEVCRIYSPSKDPSTIDEELKSCSYGGGTANKQTDEFINKKAILVSTLCYAMRFVLMGLRASYFSHIFIDETGQGIEPDVLIPISIASKNRKLYSQIVVAGDPQQLGPTVTSKLAEVILGRSILERLISYNIYQKNYHGNYNPKYITKLLRNYRSHPKILHISNELFYDNQLLPQLSIDNNQKVQFPVIFHAVDGLEEKSSYSPSTFNVKEINVVLKYVYDLINNKTEFGQVTAEDIGIVTPFKEQSMRIKKILQQEDAKEKKKIKDNVDTENTVHVFEKYKKGEKNELKSDEVIQNKNTKETNIKIKDDKEKLINEVGKDGKTKVKVQKIKNAKCQAANDVNEIKCRNLKNINVGTVELFQGQERKIIIMTTVRSKLLLHDGKQHLGFLSNPKRFNVAMTRAQAALIVIGNPRILQEDEMWRYFLKYCIDNGSYRGYKFALSESHSNNPKPVLSGSQRITTSAKLFKGKPFKFFPLDAIESKKMTADVLAKSRRCKYKEPAQSKLCESFRKLSLT
ncbi:putative helicase mov-10-B.1 [Phymastichus coffea]|uniref:putative helicase mov-10-B.1 n=1 Tax=Phymastichus coffea TaxID=108790 RepID=UPI00273AB865|nr:putative helicase mov-10-B.1 [Phymastichus coffea]